MNDRANSIVDKLLEAAYWKRYDTLTEPQQQAIYEYMVTSGGVEPDEYDDHVRNYVYYVQNVQPSSVKRALIAWGDPTPYAKMPHHDELRVRRINRLHSQGKPVWPYIVGCGRNFSEWASDTSNHGDGWHRLMLALRQNRPMEFVYMRPIKRATA